MGFHLYIITCAVSQKCVVTSYDKINTQNRVINVGFETIGGVFLMTTKFLGVSHPEKKIIAFFELDEIQCKNPEAVKKCDAFNL